MVGGDDPAAEHWRNVLVVDAVPRHGGQDADIAEI
jgi:hypothetical protein